MSAYYLVTDFDFGNVGAFETYEDAEKQVEECLENDEAVYGDREPMDYTIVSSEDAGYDLFNERQSFGWELAEWNIAKAQVENYEEGKDE